MKELLTVTDIRHWDLTMHIVVKYRYFWCTSSPHPKYTTCRNGHLVMKL